MTKYDQNYYINGNHKIDGNGVDKNNVETKHGTRAEPRADWGRLGHENGGSSIILKRDRLSRNTFASSASNNFKITMSETILPTALYVCENSEGETYDISNQIFV